MRYMLLIYLNEQALDETERVACYEESTGSRTGSTRPANTSPLPRCSRHRQQPASVEGKRLVTDGPFAETREQLGGYFLIDAKDLDEAIAIAARIPMARNGTVEIRPVVEIAGLPAD